LGFFAVIIGPFYFLPYESAIIAFIFKSFLPSYIFGMLQYNYI